MDLEEEKKRERTKTMNHGVEERSSESGREWLEKKEGEMKRS
jgi:hypothetical protein